MIVVVDGSQFRLRLDPLCLILFIVPVSGQWRGTGRRGVDTRAEPCRSRDSACREVSRGGEMTLQTMAVVRHVECNVGIVTPKSGARSMSCVGITIADPTERHILKVRISATLSSSGLMDGLEAQVQLKRRRMESNR